MTDLENYASLEERRKTLTSLVQRQKDEIVALKKKKKHKEALDLENKYEDNLLALKNIMVELPLAKAAADKEAAVSKLSAPKDASAQLDNEIIYISDKHALVLCADGSIAYTVQPAGTVEVGDLAFAADLKEFCSLPEDMQKELITGYRKAREARGAI